MGNGSAPRGEVGVLNVSTVRGAPDDPEKVTVWEWWTSLEDGVGLDVGDRRVTFSNEQARELVELLTPACAGTEEER